MDRQTVQRREADRNDQESAGLKLSPTFNLPEIYIGPGQFASSKEDIVISTLLGSCIAVALYDQASLVGGLNHFMLPSHRTKDATLVSEEARYGIHAMELLINDLLRNGANRALLRAKVFGGSTMIKLGKPSTFDVPKMNIRFAFEFLDTERIPVDSYSVGGGSPRRIYFFPRTAKVLQRFTERGESAIGKRDERYSTQLQESFAAGGKPTLFI